MRAKRVSFDRLVSPISIAVAYLRPGKYRAKKVKSRSSSLDHSKNGELDWVAIYCGRKRIWSCNPTFFQHNFINVDED